MALAARLSEGLAGSLLAVARPSSQDPDRIPGSDLDPDLDLVAAVYRWVWSSGSCPGLGTGSGYCCGWILQTSLFFSMLQVDREGRTLPAVAAVG